MKSKLVLRLQQAGLLEYDERLGLDWEWQALDGAMTKVPQGEGETGTNPTDRGKCCTKRSLLTEDHSLPIGLIVAGANHHEFEANQGDAASGRYRAARAHTNRLTAPVLGSGLDYDEMHETVAACGYTTHIRTRGEETTAKRDVPGYRTRRWVVEGTPSWLSRLRRLLIRWEKNVDPYVSMLHLACAWITFRAAGVFG